MNEKKVKINASFNELILASVGKKPNKEKETNKVVLPVKSPLRYPGGKSRAVFQIINEIYSKRVTYALLSFYRRRINRVSVSQHRNKNLWL